MVYTYKGILFSLKRQGNPVACDMNKSLGYYAISIEAYIKTNTIRLHSYKVSIVIKLIETLSRKVVTGDGARAQGIVV